MRPTDSEMTDSVFLKFPQGAVIHLLRDFRSPKRGRWLKSLQEKRIFIIMKLPAGTTIPRSLFFNRDWKNFLLHREKDQNERLA